MEPDPAELNGPHRRGLPANPRARRLDQSTPRFATMVRGVWGNLLPGHLREIWNQGAWLFVATLFNSGLGFLFWAIAARLQSAAVLGVVASIFSLSVVASSASLLGLDQGLIRFLPEMPRPRRMALQSMAISALGATALGGLITYAVFGPQTGLPLPLLPLLAFGVALPPLMAIYSLSSSLLLTAGKSGWVANQAAALGGLKLLGLGLVAVLGASALLFSIGTGYAIGALVGVAVGFSLWPRTQPGSQFATTREIARFSLGNYIGSNLWQLPDRLAASLILLFLGAASASYFYYAFIVALSLFSVSESICTSAFAHAARSKDQIGLRLPAMRLRLGVLSGLLAVVAIIFAPLALYILGGPAYEAHAMALRLLGAGVVPLTGFVYMQTKFNVRRQVRALAIIGSVCGLITLGILVLLLNWHVSIDYLPVAWITGSSIAFLVGVFYLDKESPSGLAFSLKAS